MAKKISQLPDGGFLGAASAIPVSSGGVTYRQTANPMISVKQFGAKGDNSTNDSTAFTNAIASGENIYIPPGIYIIENVPLVSQCSLFGFSQLSYNTLSSNVILRRKAGAATIFDSGGARGWRIDGVCLDGVDNTCHGIQAITGSSDALGVFANSSILNCDQGIGGSGSHYSNALSIQNSVIYGNNTGVSNFLDSRINSSMIAYNSGNGVYCSAGSSDNCISNSKVEWNQGYGILIYSTDHVTVTNNIIDRNYKVGVYFNSATQCALTGNILRRNGRNGTSGQRSHWAFEGTTNDITIAGNTTGTGKDDGGTGPLTPAYCYEWVSGSQTNINMSGNTMAGYVTAESIGNASGTAYIENVAGKLFVTGQQINEQSGRSYQSSNITGTVTAGGGTATLAMTQYPIGTFTKGLREMLVWVRDLTTGTGYMARFNVLLARDGSGASMSASAAYGEIGTAGAITVAGAGTIANLAFGSVVTDGSTFNIIVTNNNSNNIQVDIEYK